MRFTLLLFLTTTASAAERPNIVWIVAEDLSPNLGCYGDPDGRTPNLDAFAKGSARFTRAFTHAPVCAPSRSGLITGQYPTTLGSHHMRSKLVTPPPLFTDALKSAGYDVFWPFKTDFNFDPPPGWADTRDWTKNPQLLKTGKPFFAYFNTIISHESKARATAAEYQKNIAVLSKDLLHDAATVTVPPYYPDTPVVRQNLVQYHDHVSVMDTVVGDVLKILDDNNLSQNTIVFFFGDHGWGLSRGKRWLYDSGTRVPLLVRWPGHLEPGSIREDLVCFLDFGPTVISLAGGKKTDAMVGRAFLGDKSEPAPKYVFSARDRMDESYDRIRAVRGDRYRYIRNFHPELPYAQWINYMDEMPIMKEWRRLAFEGKLNETQKAFLARTKPKEELYDLEKDQYEIKNLNESPEHQPILKEMRSALDEWLVRTKDMGAVPEKEMIAKGLVKNLLDKEYAERVKLHPKTSPVP